MQLNMEEREADVNHARFQSLARDFSVWCEISEIRASGIIKASIVTSVHEVNAHSRVSRNLIFFSENTDESFNLCIFICSSVIEHCS